MSENSRTWRCPYCDGLNAWHDEVCQVCGDGRRAEAASVGSGEASEPEMPKTYTPRAREDETPRRVPEPPLTDARRNYVPPEPEPPKKKGGKGGVLVALLVALLAYGGGKLLGGQMAGGFKPSGSGSSPQIAVVTQIPRITEIPTRIPQITKIPTSVPTQAPTAVPAPATGWDYVTASDGELRSAFNSFIHGSKGGMDYVFFMDKDFTIGGYGRYPESPFILQTQSLLGSLSINGDRITVTSADGRQAVLRFADNGDNSVQLLSLNGESVDVHMSGDSSAKSDFLKYIQTTRDTLRKMG